MKNPQLFTVGPFGAAAARSLRELTGPRPVTPLAGPADLPAKPDGDGYVLFAWRPAPAIEDALDALAHRHRVPWLPVVIEHPHLRVGPAVAPGRGPCAGCFTRRRAQHSRSAEADAALATRYDTDVTAGPAGYPPTLPDLAAALAAHTIDRIAADPAGVAGAVRRIDLLSGHPDTGQVTGVHGCARCGTGRDESDRSWRELLRDLPPVLHGRAA
jgi:bacteriocin biosynthesis cyclodehydratase domain-containing protein